MKNKLVHLAMAAFAATSHLVTTASANFSGAIYTSLGDGTTVNANNYEDCELVFLNGGPQNETGSGLPDGIYLFEVTNPSTAFLLSTDPARNRQVKVVNGRILGTPGQDSGAPGDSYVAPLFGAADGDMHALGSYNVDNQSVPVQLWEFAETGNPGGVYKVTLYSVAGGAAPDPDNEMLIASPGGNSKSDNFRCVHDDGTGPGEAVLSGQKYHDVNGNGVNDFAGEEWTDAGGFPAVTIEITYWFTDKDIDGITFTVETTAVGFWSALVPADAYFSICEEVPAGYLQTGPVDGASVSSPGDGASNAVADSGCWVGYLSSADLVGLDFGNLDSVTVGGVKFYDANANGAMDGGEVTIPGFKIILEIAYPDYTTDTVELWTDAGGAWSYEVPVGSDITACEVLPLGTWVQTAPALGCHSLVDVSDDTSDLDFGNVCLGPGGGKTLGFWSNRNGQAQMNDGGTMDPELAMLVALNLRNANGTDFDCTSYAKFRTWLLNATAVNMAYMLSAQLAAMELNVEAGFVADGAIIYGGDCLGFTTINAVRTAANASLGVDGYTPDGDPLRATQECLKDSLDDANNNLNFVQAAPCLPIVYPPEE